MQITFICILLLLGLGLPILVKSDFSLSNDDTSESTEATFSSYGTPLSAQLSNAGSQDDYSAIWFNAPQQISAGFSTNFSITVNSSLGVSPSFQFSLQNNVFVVNADAEFAVAFPNAAGSDSFYLVAKNATYTQNQTSGFQTTLNDGQIHSIKISYQPPLITVCIDGKSAVMHVDVQFIVGNAKTLVGFTSSTMTETALVISNWQFSEKPGCPCSTLSCIVPLSMVKPSAVASEAQAHGLPVWEVVVIAIGVVVVCALAIAAFFILRRRNRLKKSQSKRQYTPTAPPLVSFGASDASGPAPSSPIGLSRL